MEDLGPSVDFGTSDSTDLYFMFSDLCIFCFLLSNLFRIPSVGNSGSISVVCSWLVISSRIF